MSSKLKFFNSIPAVFLISALLISSAIFASAIFSDGTSAEGDSICSGSITGTTLPGNVNGGVTSFDSHPGSGTEDNESVTLKIIGETDGLAPALRKDAACIEKEEGTYDNVPYQYSLRGWAWNTNLGFISFNCKDEINLAGG